MERESLLASQTEKKKFEDEQLQAHEQQAHVDEPEKRVEEATKRVEEVEAKVAKAVDLWRASPKFNALAQDAYVVALEELEKYISRERPDFDTAFSIVFGETEERAQEAVGGSGSSHLPC